MSILRASLVLLPLLLFAGCGAEATEAPATPPAGENATAPSAAALAILAKADAKDGTVDNVVHRCAGCSLGMDGMADHALKVGGYTMHFCKDACLAKYSGDPEKAILALKVN